MEPASEGARVELARDMLGSCDRSGMVTVGEAFLGLNFRDKERENEGIRDPSREVRPSIGLNGTSSARLLFAHGFGAKSLSSRRS